MGYLWQAYTHKNPQATHTQPSKNPYPCHGSGVLLGWVWVWLLIPMGYPGHSLSGSKAALKVTRESKTKEMTFSINEDNYCDFMKACLSKHGEKRYKVTGRSTFSFKYLCLPGRKYIHIHLPILHDTNWAPYPVSQTILMLMKRMITKIWSRRSLRGSWKSCQKGQVQ